MAFKIFNGNGTELHKSKEFPELAALGSTRMARRLVRGLLAHVGRGEFPPLVRHRRDPHVHRSLDEQFSSAFKPGGFFLADRRRVEPGCGLQISPRTPHLRRNGLPLDPRYPLWVRLLSLFHVILPILFLWALHRLGYDRRAWALQSVIALVAFSAARFAPPAMNINFVFSDPFFHHTWTAPIQVVLSTLFLGIVVYLPTHLILRRIFPAPRSS